MNLGGKKVDPAASLKNARPMHLGPIVMLQPEGSKIVHLSSEMGAGVVQQFQSLPGETLALRGERMRRWICKWGSEQYDSSKWRIVPAPLPKMTCHLGFLDKNPSALGITDGADSFLATDISCDESVKGGDPEGIIALSRLSKILRTKESKAPGWGLGEYAFRYGSEHFDSTTAVKLQSANDQPQLDVEVSVSRAGGINDSQADLSRDIEEINSPGGPAKIKLVDSKTWLSKMWTGISHLIHVIAPTSIGGGEIYLWRAEYTAKDMFGNQITLAAEMQFLKSQSALEPEHWQQTLNSCGWG